MLRSPLAPLTLVVLLVLLHVLFPCEQAAIAAEPADDKASKQYEVVAA